MQELYGLRTVAKVYGVGLPTAVQWVRAGHICPTARGEQSYNPEYLLSQSCACGFGVLAALRRKGYVFELIRPVVEFFERMTDEQFERAAADDMQLLYVEGFEPGLILPTQIPVIATSEFNIVQFRIPLKKLLASYRRLLKEVEAV